MITLAPKPFSPRLLLLQVSSFVYIAALYLGLASCGSSANNTGTVLNEGDRIGDLSFQTLSTSTDSSETYSSRELKDKLVVLNFWASWCVPCRNEMASLQRLSKSMAPSAFQVIGISVDEDVNLAREFVLEQQLSFLNLHDPDQYLARNVFGINTYPVTFIIAPDGTIAHKIMGEQDWDNPDLLLLLNNMLPGKTHSNGAMTVDG